MSKDIRQIDTLFTKPLPSSRSGAFYNSFPYPTKISPETIALYIACATKPGDIILDSFAGSGSTGIAALLCEKPTDKMVELAKQYNITPTWGARNAILYEIGTYATFAAKTLTNRLSAERFSSIVDEFLSKAEALINNAYVVKDPYGNQGVMRHIIWTEILLCPECGAELDFFTYGTSRKPVKFKEKILCPHCKKTNAIDNMPFATEAYFDRILHKSVTRKRRKIAWVYGTTNNKKWDRAGTLEDDLLFQKFENEIDLPEKPKKIVWGDLYRVGYHFGITHLHQFYTLRNYYVMYKLWELTDTYPEIEANALKLLLLSYNSTHSTLMTRVVAKQNVKDFVLTGAQSGVLYISRLPVEKNILLGLKRKVKPFNETYAMLEGCSGTITVHNQSSSKMIEKNQSIDFVFTDPPFGDYIPYAEVNQINELWLPSVTNRSEEVIISDAQNKTVESYSDMLKDVFSELERVIKDDHHVAVVFHSAKAEIWEAFSNAIKGAGFEIELSSMLDKTQASFKQVVSKDSVQGDPLFLLKKKQNPKEVNETDKSILQKVLNENPHEKELEIRHCYSMYVGKCLEKGLTISMDAKQVYDYIKAQNGAILNGKST